MSNIPPRVSYTPEERPISFPSLDTENVAELPGDGRGNADLLSDIDDAIDRVFEYGREERREESREGPMLLPSTTYDPKKDQERYGRKDSVMPGNAHASGSASGSGTGKELPPLPVREE